MVIVKLDYLLVYYEFAHYNISEAILLEYENRNILFLRNYLIKNTEYASSFLK